MQGEAFSALRKGGAGINVLSTLSPVQLSGRGVETMELSNGLSLPLSLSGVALETRGGGREKGRGKREGRLLENGSLHATPCHCDVLSVCFSLPSHAVATETENFSSSSLFAWTMFLSSLS